MPYFEPVYLSAPQFVKTSHIASRQGRAGESRDVHHQEVLLR